VGRGRRAPPFLAREIEAGEVERSPPDQGGNRLAERWLEERRLPRSGPASLEQPLGAPGELEHACEARLEDALEGLLRQRLGRSGLLPARERLEPHLDEGAGRGDRLPDHLRVPGIDLVGHHHRVGCGRQLALEPVARGRLEPACGAVEQGPGAEGRQEESRGPIGQASRGPRSGGRPGEPGERLPPVREAEVGQAAGAPARGRLGEVAAELPAQGGEEPGGHERILGVEVVEQAAHGHVLRSPHRELHHVTAFRRPHEPGRPNLRIGLLLQVVKLDRVEEDQVKHFGVERLELAPPAGLRLRPELGSGASGPQPGEDAPLVHLRAPPGLQVQEDPELLGGGQRDQLRGVGEPHLPDGEVELVGGQ
jgi:hypothetical protein